MVSEREVDAANDYWAQLQYEARNPNNHDLRAMLRRVGNDPSISVILELYAEYTYGVRRLKRRGPMIFSGSRKPGNDGHR